MNNLGDMMGEIIVSVILPIKDEEDYIKKCLESMIQQDFPKDKMEILAVDGMSEDNTIKIIDKIKNKYCDLNLKVLLNEKQIVPPAMNIGIENARGDYIIRIDAHSEYSKNYISKCVEYLDKNPEVWNVGGPMRAVGTNYLGKAIAFLHHSPFGLGGGKFHDVEYEGYVDTVYLGAFRKEVFNKIGLYNEKLIRNQDIELNSRIQKAGGKIYLTPEIKSYYYNRDSIFGLIRQNFRNGLWNIKTKNINSDALSIRHFIPLFFVLSLLAGLSLSVIESTRLFGNFIFSASLGSYFLVSLYFSSKVIKEKGFKYFWVMPFLFFVLHFSYGIGSLVGLFKVLVSKN